MTRKPEDVGQQTVVERIPPYPLNETRLELAWSDFNRMRVKYPEHLAFKMACRGFTRVELYRQGVSAPCEDPMNKALRLEFEREGYVDTRGD